MNHRFDERPAMRPESGRCVRRLSRVATCLLAPGLALSASPVWAQQQDDVSEPVTVSRPVVQALPSSENSGTRDLDSALSRLARDPRNVTALIDAGNAALRIGDTEAALGFFSRADEVAPGNGRVKAQIASALLQGENPFDAIRYFDDAERSGADTTAMAGDRGLAYDLIGDNATAQRWYQLALSRGANDEVSRRYALSLAIAGDKRGAEAVLAPQVQRQDRGAWRVRTFIMAITGNQDEAVSIAYASMPQDLAAGISPYLRYMPRLTLAQQAAAANFGRFPRAADIGRDDPRVVQYAALHPRPSRSADAGLIPTGDALGGKVSREKRRRPGRGEDNTRLAVATPAPAMPVLTPPPPPPPIYSAPPRTTAPIAAPVRVAEAAPVLSAPIGRPAPVPGFSILDRPPAPRGTQPSRTAIAPAPTPTVMPTPAPVRVAVAAPALAPAPTPSPAPVRSPAPASGPGFDLARVQGTTPTVQATPAPLPVSAPIAAPVRPAPAPVALAVATPPASMPTPAPAPAPTPAPVAAPPPARDFASLFNGFRPPEEEQTRPVAAVDIARIKPTRPKPPEPKVAEPVKPDPREAKESKDSKGRVRGERPDGPTAVSRIEERTGAATRDGKNGKDVKDGKEAKDAKGKGGKVAPPSHPSRIWVQVLTGGNKDMFDDAWRRMARQASDAFRGRKPYVTPWRSNFRLLTGPFESEAAAQAFLNQLTRAHISGFQWTSPAGQAIDTLPLK